MPIALTAEQLAMAESVRRWASRAPAIASVRGLEASGGVTGGSDPARPGWAKANWAALAGLGVFSIALAEGGSVTDVAVVVEQLAACLAPGPVLPTLLAALLLAKDGPLLEKDSLLDEIGSGQVSVATALSASGLSAVRTTRGGLRVTGTAGLVLGAGDTSHVLLGARAEEGEAWFVLASGAAGVRVSARTPVDFSRALADVTVDAEVPAGQVLAGVGPSW